MDKLRLDKYYIEDDSTIYAKQWYVPKVEYFSVLSINIIIIWRIAVYFNNISKWRKSATVSRSLDMSKTILDVDL